MQHQIKVCPVNTSWVRVAVSPWIMNMRWLYLFSVHGVLWYKMHCCRWIGKCAIGPWTLYRPFSFVSIVWVMGQYVVSVTCASVTSDDDRVNTACQMTSHQTWRLQSIEDGVRFDWRKGGRGALSLIFHGTAGALGLILAWPRLSVVLCLLVWWGNWTSLVLWMRTQSTRWTHVVLVARIKVL